MKLIQFIKLLKDGYPFDTLKTIIHKDLKNNPDDKRLGKFFRALNMLPGYATAKNMEESRECIKKELKNWTFDKLPEAAVIESITDFSAATGERIKITTEDYAKYFDSFLTEDDENKIGLNLEIYSRDTKKSFKAVMYGKDMRVTRQTEVSSYLPMGELDLDYMSLVQYLTAVPGAEEDSKITVAEAISRGTAYINASSVAGEFVNRKFLELFNDLF